MQKLSFDDDFRARWTDRRALAVDIVRRVTEGESPEAVFQQLKNASMYDRLDPRDQGSMRRFFADIRIIIEAWASYYPYERDVFLRGEVVYSTMCKRGRELI